MISPVFKKPEKTEELTITLGAKKIFKAIYRQQNSNEMTDENTPLLQVSDLISKMSFYYEKIRNAVHYREEYLLRKDAIARIIKRQVIIEGPIKFNKVDVQATARHLLIELIRAGYLPNNVLPENKVEEVSEILDKYLSVRARATTEAAGSVNFFGGGVQKEFSSKVNTTNWLVGLAAAEIEESIGRDEVSKTIVSVMYNLLERRIELPASLPYEKDLSLQIYIAIHRLFLKFDDDMLALILFRYFNADWDSPSEKDISRIAKNISTIRSLIETQLNHPLSQQLNRVVSTYTVYFNILKDVVAEDPTTVYDEFFDDPKAFTRRVKQSCTKRYVTVKTKLWRSAWRSIIYIILTKSIFAVLLEVPAATLFGAQINPFALAINVSFPALLLFFAVAITRLPGEDNTKKVISGIEEIVFEEKKKPEAIILRKPRGRHRFMNFIFGIIYAITFFVSFGVIVWLLDLMQFSWVSTIVFLFFLAFVSFFIMRIRRNSKEWIVVESRDNIFRFFLDFFSVPIVTTGKWLSTKFSQINVFVFVLDFIIEAPFKIFVEIAEEWTKYVRERKEQI